MSTASTIPAVLAALEARWKSVVDDDVQVIYGPRGTVTVTKESIVTIGAVQFTVDPATFTDAGGVHDDEDYLIACVAECTVTGTDQHPATTAALALFSTLASALRIPNETLGVSGVLYARVQGTGQVIPAGDSQTLAYGRSAAVPFTVHVVGTL